MCRAIEEMRDEAASEAAHETQIKMALNMLNDGMDIQTVVKYSELTVEEVESLIKKELHNFTGWKYNADSPFLIKSPVKFR